ncbi:MAG: TIR domain-containing protein [Deltaproteobacteria bacterium]|nr:TIR domain-containing protein [Deltaproteobacteria bacterium]
MTKVFLSYARGDDGEPYNPAKSFVVRLHTDLTAAGFDVWFDRVSLPSRQLTFHQEIADAIRARDRIVLVVGPKAAHSDYVRQEWRWGLELDKPVIPILLRGDYQDIPGELGLLHCDDFRDDAQYPVQLAKLIANLRLDAPPLGALYGVPNLPPNFLGRPDLLRRVKDALLVDLQKPVVISGAAARVGMQGMGGIGKSVLAAALARDPEVRHSYPDGIIWVAVGQPPDRVSLLRDVARHLGSQEPFQTEVQGQGVLRQLLLQKAVLLVLDDVWHASDAKAFDVLGPRCRALVTTRDIGILSTMGGECVPVSLFTEPEALQLLAGAVDMERAALPREAQEVVRECGCLPLAVALCGGMAKAGHSWQDIVAALREADLEWPENREETNEQHRTIWNAMKASYDALKDVEKPRFAELAVFATGRTVPEAAVHVLWEHTGPLSDRNCSKLLISLSERSLIQLDQKAAQPGEAIERRFRLHDLVYDFATRLAGEPKALHRTLLDAYRGKCPDSWPSGPDDGYFFQQLVGHQADAGDWMEAGELVTDFPWLMRKCELGLFDSISYDYGTLERRAPAEIAKRLEFWSTSFREKIHILRRGNDEWPGHKILLQLAIEHADNSPITIAAEQYLHAGKVDWVWLRRMQRVEEADVSPCLSVLEGHTFEVKGALQLPDGRILSWSGDRTLRLWDTDGRPLAVLEGHTYQVRGALQLTDGRMLSWSDGHTLRLWDTDGRPLAVLEGHTYQVRGALQLTDGRMLSWSDGHTLRLWDTDGRPLAVLEGHTDWVKGVLQLTDGRILSWSGDHTLRLWDTDGRPLAVLEGHTNWVNGALQLNDERILSWSDDRTLRLWDTDGRPLVVLEGHTNWTNGALQLNDGRILSWAWDHILRIWDSKTGACIEVLNFIEFCIRYPESIPLYLGRDLYYSDIFARAERRYGEVNLPVKGQKIVLCARWHADSDGTARLLRSDGTLVLTQANGQVCFLKLYYGATRISLDQFLEWRKAQPPPLEDE